MSDEPFDNFRLSLMQDFLPVSLAMVERARKGGPSKLIEAFTNSDDPFNELRLEGEPVAKTVREKLDQVSPGLGNPVMSVKVDVNTDIDESEPIFDEESLIEVLDRIENRLEELEQHFQNEGPTISSPSSEKE